MASVLGPKVRGFKPGRVVVVVVVVEVVAYLTTLFQHLRLYSVDF
jgi:hypothetical protein